MPARNDSLRDEVERETTTTVASVRLVRAATAPALARRHVQRELGTPVPTARLHDIVLLTSEVVTNAVEHSHDGPIEISVVGGATFTRIEVSSPGESWGRGPELRSREPDEDGGWGLFLVEQLSDRWGVRDSERAVWFEFDHPASPGRPNLEGLAASPGPAIARPGYPAPMDDIWGVLQQVRYPASRQDLIDTAVAADASSAVIARLEALERERYEDAEEVSQDLVDRRVESNPALVSITAEPCERCGFLRVPGESHSCIEEKARFADSVNAISDEFDAIDERARRDAG